CLRRFDANNPKACIRWHHLTPLRFRPKGRTERDAFSKFQTAVRLRSARALRRKAAAYSGAFSREAAPEFRFRIPGYPAFHPEQYPPFRRRTAAEKPP